MQRRRATLWLIMVALLGSLLSPALAFRTVAPKTCCCCPSETTEPCPCHIAPAPPVELADRTSPLLTDTVVLFAPCPEPCPAPETLALTSSLTAEQTHAPFALSRGPDSGRAPPVA